MATAMTARILIIEDHPDNMDMMVFLLQSFGYATVSACDGEAGVQAAFWELPDLVVCDVHLPTLDGYGVLRQLKAIPATRSMPVIAVTALAMVGDREKLLAAGFDDYISKPIDPESFVAQVEKHLPADQVAPRLAQPARPEAVDPPQPVARYARVLVVDDSPVNRELIRGTLEPFGYEVTLAESVHAGLLKVRHAPFDLIVSDLHMPKENGIVFLRQVKADAALAPIPFMFLSASYEDNANRELAVQLGATRFLRRPIDPLRLLAEIEACLPAEKQGKRHGNNTGR